VRCSGAAIEVKRAKMEGITPGMAGTLSSICWSRCIRGASPSYTVGSCVRWQTDSLLGLKRLSMLVRFPGAEEETDATAKTRESGNLGDVNVLDRKPFG